MLTGLKVSSFVQKRVFYRSELLESGDSMELKLIF